MISFRSVFCSHEDNNLDVCFHGKKKEEGDLFYFKPWDISFGEWVSYLFLRTYVSVSIVSLNETVKKWKSELQIVAMFSIISGFAGLLKRSKTITDNATFRLHYVYTFTLLVTFSAMIGATQHFGTPIGCKASDYLTGDMLNAYCWLEGTWTIHELTTNIMVTGKNSVPYPGVGAFDRNKHTKLFHTFYQWVPVALTVSALAFYFPRLLWKGMEGGHLKNMTQGLKYFDPTRDDEEVKNLAMSFYKQRRKNILLGLGFILCEIANLANSVLQWYLADLFLSGQFCSFGRRFVEYNMYGYKDPDTINPVSTLFPKMASCTFRLYGRSGSIQEEQTLCILPLNVVNEKIAICLWFWLMGVIFLSAIAVTSRLILLTIPPIRKWVMIYLCLNYSPFNYKYICSRLCMGTLSKDMRLACDGCCYGDIG